MTETTSIDDSGWETTVNWQGEVSVGGRYVLSVESTVRCCDITTDDLGPTVQALFASDTTIEPSVYLWSNYWPNSDAARAESDLLMTLGIHDVHVTDDPLKYSFYGPIVELSESMAGDLPDINPADYMDARDQLFAIGSDLIYVATGTKPKKRPRRLEDLFQGQEVKAAAVLLGAASAGAPLEVIYITGGALIFLRFAATLERTFEEIDNRVADRIKKIRRP